MRTTYRALLFRPGFRALMLAQFLGALNGNTYRFVLTFLALSQVSGSQAPPAAGCCSGSAYVSLIGGLFILPFLLFSGYAGQVADSFSKRGVLIATKSAEVPVMLLGFTAMLWHSLPAMLAVLFLASMQAAFFSPAKYGILPEILPAEDLMWGNALLEMSTFLAIVLGAFLGGVLFDKLHGDIAWVGILLAAVALWGLLASLGIARTPAPNARRAFRLDPWHGIFTALRALWVDRQLGLTVAAIAYFWFLGALVQLVMPLYGIKTLGLDATRTSLLQVLAACGIACGSLLIGRVARLDLRLVVPGALGIVIASAILGLAGYAVVPPVVSTAAFALLGFFGGVFIVPLNSLLQHNAPPAMRGRLIAIGNIANALGILGASGLNLLLGAYFGLTPPAIFAVMAAMTAGAVLLLRALYPRMSKRFDS